jgi:Na+-driven multidrug efflux pump
MYTAVLVIHNIFRWVVLAAALFALFRAYSGWLGKREWTKTDRLSGTLFSISLDIQLLFGLILYVAGEWYTVFQSMAEAMANETMRFFGLEHIFYMLVAVILVHAGSVLARKASEDIARHRRAALWYSLVVVILLIAIPWWRPLLRF